MSEKRHHGMANEKQQRSISSFFQRAKPIEKPEKTEITSPKAVTPDVSSKRLSQFEHNSEEVKRPKIHPSKPTPAKPAKPTKPQEQASSKASLKKLTPLEKQFILLKSDHPDKILAIQVGYKYKFFGQDAVEAAGLLDITLLPGNIALDERIHDRFAYCSVPDNRLHVHLQRLLNGGKKVAVVKQTETAAIKSVESKSGLFDRSITGVYTKATYMGEEMGGGGDADVEISSILCIDQSQSGTTAVVAVEPLTGEIVYDVFSDNSGRDEVETRLAYLTPSEVVILEGEDSNGSGVDTAKVVRAVSPSSAVHKRRAGPMADVHAYFADHFAEPIAEHYRLHFHQSVQRCICTLAEYLAEYGLASVFAIPGNVSALTDARKYMLLPAPTLRALDIFQVSDSPSARRGTLFWLLDNTRTRHGSRMLKRWLGQPLTDKQAVENRLEAVQELRDGQFSHLLDVVKNTVSRVGKNGLDLDRGLIRAHYAAASAKSGGGGGSEKMSRDEIFRMLRSFHDLLSVFRKFGRSDISALSSSLLRDILTGLADLADSNVVDDLVNMVNSGFSGTTDFFDLSHERFAAIAKENDSLAAVEAQLNEQLQSIRQLLKRPNLQYVTNLRDTHLIEVRNGRAVDSLPSDWIKISATKSVSRFRPPEVARLHRQLVYHGDTLVRACDECFREFLRDIDAHYAYFHRMVTLVSEFDCLVALSSVGAGNPAFRRPHLTDDPTITVSNARHPILDALAPANHVPNDINVRRDGSRVVIITGPNMGGKSSYVKQVALLVIMCQVGCFLPCDEAKMGVFDSIFIRMGASDNILRGSSTFMVEMAELANILRAISPRSLVILDEIGRGTGTSDGIALAHAILSYLINDSRAPLTFFITHYPSLHLLEYEHSGVENCHMAFVEKSRPGASSDEWPEVVFLYRLVQGVVSNLYGLNVAKLAGIPLDIIENAHKVSESMKRKIETGIFLGKLGGLSGENVGDVLARVTRS